CSTTQLDSSPMANSFSVISPSYCAPYSLNLQINTGEGSTYDINGKRVFYINKDIFTLHKRRVMYDDKGNPIVTLYNKNMTLHRRCKVFRGEKDDPFELLFSVKRSSMIHSEMIKLDVFLANNEDERMCDFRVIIDANKSSCTVYAAESPTVVAKMENNWGFNVWVNPNVDYAFIVALLIISNEMVDEDYHSTNLVPETLKTLANVSQLAN
ncbi:Protein LURP-one-related 15, partial [Mucuna pruriens]